MLRALAIVTMATAASTAGCLPAFSGPDGSRRIAVVGDSIVAGAKADLDAALEGADRSVGGVSGIDLPAGATLLVQPAVDAEPDVLVVELGINDAHDGWDPLIDEPNLDRVLDLVDPVPCTIWLLPDVLEPTALDHDHGQTTSLHQRIGQLWAALDARAAAHPRLHLDRFGVEQRTHPERYQADGVHPDEAGSAALAAHVAEAIDEHCPA